MITDLDFPIARGFTSRIANRTWIGVSTTCGSGWVDDQHARFLLTLNPGG
jgi:hypothetical protein